MTAVAETLAPSPSQDHQLTLSREVDAPIALVWRAWTDATHLARWFFPADCTMHNPRFDVRPGGAYAADYHGDSGGVFRMRGVFHEVSPPDRLVFSHGWADETGRVEHDTRVTVTLEERGQGTLVTIHQVGLPTDAARDAHREGWSQVLERLVGLVATGH